MSSDAGDLILRMLNAIIAVRPLIEDIKTFRIKLRPIIMSKATQKGGFTILSGIQMLIR